MSTTATFVGKPLEIPVIDLTGFRSGRNIEPIVEQVGDAVSRVGFFQIVGHGVPIAVLEAVCDSFLDVVALPRAAKEGLDSPTGHPFRGLSALYDDDGELRVERLQVCAFDDPVDAAAAGVTEQYIDYFHPNVWPDDSALKSLWQDCFGRTRALGTQVMEIFARALGLPPGFFAARLGKDASTFSGNYYPPQTRLSTTETPNVIFGEHSDSGMLTLLYQRGDYTGLQIRDADDRWIDVPVVDGAFIVNIGDLMSRWTNGRWPATRHRVVASTEPGRSRVSLPTFLLPSVDVEVAPLPVCVGPEGPMFDAVTPYEWEAMFLARNPATLPARMP